MESTFKKYSEAFRVLRNQIERKELDHQKFLNEYELPANFIKACVSLHLINRIKHGVYSVYYKCESNICIGKMISREISVIEKIRKQHFNQTNKS